MAPPLVGVVIATFRGERTLAEAIQSIQAQSYSEFVCCIVDDGSTDQTLRLARSLTAEDRRFQVLAQEHAGTSTTRNHGLASLDPSARYVTFLDQDDVWEPDALATLVRAASAAPGLVGAHGLGRYIDASGALTRPGEFEEFGRSRSGCAGGREYPWPLEKPTTFETLLLRCTVFPPGLVLARRDLYDRLGGFDPAIRYTEDWDMLLRLARYGDFGFVNRVVVRWRLHGSNTSSTPAMPHAYMQVRRKTYWSAENSSQQKALVRDAWKAVQRVYAAEHLREARRQASRGQLVQASSKLARVPLAWARALRGHPGKYG